MSDEYSFGLTPTSSNVAPSAESTVIAEETAKKITPELSKLKLEVEEASQLVGDMVMKNYLSNLNQLELLPLPDELKNIEDIRFFKINEMVYQKDEFSAYKLATVFHSVQNLNCAVFLMFDSDGIKTNFYMGVRSLDDSHTTSSLKNTLQNALIGQFSGVKTSDLLDTEAQEILTDIPTKNVTSVSCVAQNKDQEIKDNAHFLQGLEKMILAMDGQKYTGIILAKSTSQEQLLATRAGYEQIYSQLSPFARMQLSYSSNESINISDAISQGISRGTSFTESQGTNVSYSKGTSHSTSTSVSTPDMKALVAKGVATAVVGVASFVTAPLTGGASLVAAGALAAASTGISVMGVKNYGENENFAENENLQVGQNDNKAYGVNEGSNENVTHSRALTTGTSETTQLTAENKQIISTLNRIEEQLKRIDECESLGMWECAAYFLSDSQQTAEMAAGTYKALVSGTKSGVETSAINVWNNKNKEELPVLRDYLTNFIHPIFLYHGNATVAPVTPASLLSGNELAIQMGLPRKSVCGFPVIEHAEFAREVIQNQIGSKDRKLDLGIISHMGVTNESQKVSIDIDALCSHTFITGSTGSGKSNTIYHLLHSLSEKSVKFLVVEPTKGEYKNVFGTRKDVSVYGTNPKLTPMLRINPFKFHQDIHILEHLDRLVDIFNVCWPMYAAMPAILKQAMERAYEVAGWDLKRSVNNIDENLFPNFVDVLEQISVVLKESEYSTEFQGNFIGALSTRVRSLTNGINGMIFTQNDLSDHELFEENVVVDLSRVGSMETKALIMGLLVMKLSEYYMVSDKENEKLRHVTVLEEAHNLLKRTSTEQSTEGSNLLGKSVEMLSNAIAEMRTYGEGFIIADQSPNMLDMSAIRNTNTKIIMKLPDEADRELVGKSANLNDDQIVELSRLKTGVAAVYQNNWLEPVLCQVPVYEYEKTKYRTAAETKEEIDLAEKSLLDFLVCEGNVENQEQLKEIVLGSDLKSSVKASTVAFIGSVDQSERRKLFTSLVYDFFNSQEIFERFVKANDMAHWGKLVVPELRPSLIHLPSEVINMLLSYLVEKHEQETGDMEFSQNFMAMYKEKGGIYNV